MKNYSKNKSKLFLCLIIFLALGFRLIGLNWDSGQHLHPDERFLTMVANDIKLPLSVSQYLNPQISTLSPYNNNYSFFIYGTFPLFLTKTVGVLTGNNDYGNLHFVGRILSALFDLGIVFLLFKIGQKIFNNKIGLFSAFLYSIMVLPIQLSHFFTVDTFLNFFIVLSFYFLTAVYKDKDKVRNHLFLGISFGFALACKISALYFLPIIGLGYLFLFIPKNYKVLFFGLIFFFSLLLTFRFLQPIAFSSGSFLNWQPNPQFLQNLKELKNMSGSNSWYPPSVQWHSTTPLLFPLKNLILWGLGLPLGVLSIFAFVFSLVTLFKNKFSPLLFFSILWVFGLFVFQGIQFCKTMRYFLPIYPFLALLTAFFLSKIKTNYVVFLILAVSIYPLSFLSIYFRPVTRVTASKWIYKNIPAGSVVTFEEWDDGLPLPLPGSPYNIYLVKSVFMYDQDTPEKWQKLNKVLNEVEYIFLTSNRAFGSTMKLPERYPQTIEYYQSLFEETGDFQKIAEFNSYPCFPPWGDKHLFCLNDDSAEEAFTVYDHPKVMIFKKIKIN